MFTLGIPKNDYRRATRVLDYESQPSIPYNAELQDDGFYNFSFPGMDEYDFEKISIKLKGEGVRIVGADEALTEKQIMKLANLIKEDSPEEHDFIDDIKVIQCVQCNSSGELKIEEPTLEFLEAMVTSSRLQ